MHLVPYLTDYKSIAEVRAAFHKGADFRIADVSSRWDDKPVNKSQIVGERIATVTVRYAALRKVCVVLVNEKWPPPARKTRPVKLALAAPDVEDSNS